VSYPPPTLIVEIPTEVVNTVRDLRAENASLRAALTTMRDKHTAWSREDLCVMYEQAIDERESLRRENAALRAALTPWLAWEDTGGDIPPSAARGLFRIARAALDAARKEAQP